VVPRNGIFRTSAVPAAVVVSAVSAVAVSAAAEGLAAVDFVPVEGFELYWSTLI
jgi:hypothetical protein